MADKQIRLSVIAAVARNHVIGHEGKMLWHIPSDFKHFKHITMGKPMVMGRKQYESVGRPLPGRVNIVVSGQQGYQPDGVLVFNTLDAALDHARNLAVADGVDEVMVIGGGEIYRQSMPHVDRLYISHVDLEPNGDVIFPKIDKNLWRATQNLPVNADPRDDFEYSITIYDRIHR